MHIKQGCLNSAVINNVHLEDNPYQDIQCLFSLLINSLDEPSEGKLEPNEIPLDLDKLESREDIKKNTFPAVLLSDMPLAPDTNILLLSDIANQYSLNSGQKSIFQTDLSALDKNHPTNPINSTQFYSKQYKIENSAQKMSDPTEKMSDPTEGESDPSLNLKKNSPQEMIELLTASNLPAIESSENLDPIRESFKKNNFSKEKPPVKSNEKKEVSFDNEAKVDSRKTPSIFIYDKEIPNPKDNKNFSPINLPHQHPALKEGNDALFADQKSNELYLSTPSKLNIEIEDEPSLTENITKKLTLHMNKTELGEITAKIVIQENKSIISFLTPNNHTKELIENYISHLKEVFNEAQLPQLQTTIQHQFGQEGRSKKQSNPDLFKTDEIEPMKHQPNLEKKTIADSIVDTYA